MKFQNAVIGALQEASESHLVDFLEDTNLYAFTLRVIITFRITQFIHCMWGEKGVVKAVFVGFYSGFCKILWFNL